MMTVESIAGRLAKTPFVPHPALKNAHAQTILASLIPRRLRLLNRSREQRFFDVSPGARLLGHCSWQEDRKSKPTLLIVHGLEGSIDSRYMQGTAEKALAEGYNAIRLNLRNCGGTHHLSSSIYHAGLTGDLRSVVEELVESDKLTEIYAVGFSLGGNMVLKMAGEDGAALPEQVRGLVAVSPSIDLPSCAAAIEMRSNILYHMKFLMNLRASMRRKARDYPALYDVSRLRGAWTLRKFDDIYTAPHSGFRDVTDYYERASALPFISNITAPALIIQAKDDPFIPFAPFESPEITANPNVTLIAPDRGGHVGFISARPDSYDRFWAETIAVRFVKLIKEQHAG